MVAQGFGFEREVAMDVASCPLEVAAAHRVVHSFHALAKTKNLDNPNKHGQWHDKRWTEETCAHDRPNAVHSQALCTDSYDGDQCFTDACMHSMTSVKVTTTRAQ